MTARRRLEDSYRGNLAEQARLIERFREHMASEPKAPTGDAIYGFDWRAHEAAVARWHGGLEYFAGSLALQLELHLKAES